MDISTSSRATIGGMAANNSCGSRSLRYGIMADNVLAIEGILADGERVTFEQVPGNLEGVAGSLRYLGIIQKLRAIAASNAGDIQERFAQLRRRVGGYNLDSIDPAGHNMARLVIGSEGTLAYFTRIKLALQPLPGHKVLGVCHFPSFRQAMASAQHIVELGPTAVELVDRSILDLAEAIPAFREILPRFVRGRPESLLLVEFAGDELEPQMRSGPARGADGRSRPAGQCGARDRAGRSSLGLGNSHRGAQHRHVDEGRREAGLVHRGLRRPARKPRRLHGAPQRCVRPARHQSTWYAHASEGCLHVRPILNIEQEQGVRAMRQIAEAAFAMVREYKGSHSASMAMAWCAPSPRGDVRAPPGARLRGGQGQLRPARATQPRQGRPRAQDG